MFMSNKLGLVEKLLGAGCCLIHHDASSMKSCWLLVAVDCCVEKLGERFGENRCWCPESWQNHVIQMPSHALQAGSAKSKPRPALLRQMSSLKSDDIKAAMNKVGRSPPCSCLLASYFRR